MGVAGPSRPVALGAVAVACGGALAASAWLSRSAASKDSSGAAGSPALSAAPSSAPTTDAVHQEQEQQRARRAWAAKLVVAAGAGRLDVVNELLAAPPPGPEKGLLDVDAELPPSGQMPNVTAAYVAALHGHEAVLTELLQRGADPNVRCIKQSQWDGAFTLTELDTALVVACKEGHLSCVESLLASGADPNVDCSSEYFEGAVEWGDDDDGNEMFYYTALDVTDRAAVGSKEDPKKWRQIRELLTGHGARHTSQLQFEKRKSARVRVTTGSRMGA